MSYVFGAMLVSGLLALLVTQGGDAATAAMLAGAGEAVTLCLDLAGAYLLFMGLMGVATRGRGGGADRAVLCGQHPGHGQRGDAVRP